MAITGNLRTMQLSDLLQWLSMGQKTGTLLVHGSPGEKRIYFDQGRIISSSSTVEREYLGHFLVAHGYITEEELTRAMEVQEESKILLGKILVMIGAISEEDLAVILRLKAAETIYDIFLWNEGAFAFVDGNLPQLPMVPISIDVTGLVMEGLRRFDEWSRIRTRIGSHREIPAIVAPIDLDTLSERERLVLKTIDGVRSIVFRTSRSRSLNVSRSIGATIAGISRCDPMRVRMRLHSSNRRSPSMTRPVTSMEIGTIGSCGRFPSTNSKAPSFQRKMS